MPICYTPWETDWRWTSEVEEKWSVAVNFPGTFFAYVLRDSYGKDAVGSEHPQT